MKDTTSSAIAFSLSAEALSLVGNEVTMDYDPSHAPAALTFIPREMDFSSPGGPAILVETDLDLLSEQEGCGCCCCTGECRDYGEDEVEYDNGRYSTPELEEADNAAVRKWNSYTSAERDEYGIWSLEDCGYVGPDL